MAIKVNQDRPLVNYDRQKVVLYLLAPTNLRVYRKEKMIIFYSKQNTFKCRIVKHLQISYVGGRFMVGRVVVVVVVVVRRTN